MSNIQPFTIKVSDEDLAALQARLAATRWIDDVFEGDWDYGIPVPLVRELCTYWRDRFDWRALEARINSYGNFLTQIDGLTIHCLHHRSPRPDAVPLLLLHGWPGSFLEFIDMVDDLATPEPGQPAFHVITPSLPGYGFSTTRTGTGPQASAAMMATLMERLGYDRYMVQGGDWGSVVGTVLAREFPEHVIGLHLNVLNGAPPPDADVSVLSPQERAWADELTDYHIYPHVVLNGQTPASLAYALNDSPAGLAAWLGERFHIFSAPDTKPSFDAMLSTIALYWFTRTAGSAAMFYREVVKRPPVPRYVSVPTAGAIFPYEVVKLPRAWAERLFNIAQWNVFDRGGHFAALEVPELLLGDIRDFARRLIGDSSGAASTRS